MGERVTVAKTYKLFIGGKFPRSESGRSWPVEGADGVVAHVSLASRKDLRDAVEAARKAQPGWAALTAYNRGQILYRMAEMLEARRVEFEGLLGKRRPSPGRKSRGGVVSPRDEVAAAVDRLVCFGGWADKFAQVLGCNNPVAGPYYNFTVPEPTGVVAVVAPPSADEPPLLGLVSLVAPPLCSGNAVVAVGSESSPLVAAVLGEVCATSDLPAGVINLLTGKLQELLPHIASHRGIDAVHAAGFSTPAEAAALRQGVAENLKRVKIHKDAPGWLDDGYWRSPWTIEPFVEMKTVWHPAGA